MISLYNFISFSPYIEGKCIVHSADVLNNINIDNIYDFTSVNKLSASLRF